MQLFPKYFALPAEQVVSGCNLLLVLFCLTLKMKLYCLMPEKFTKGEKEALNKKDLQSVWASAM